jgi:hypothetical protein
MLLISFQAESAMFTGVTWWRLCFRSFSFLWQICSVSLVTLCQALILEQSAVSSQQSAAYWHEASLSIRSVGSCLDLQQPLLKCPYCTATGHCTSCSAPSFPGEGLDSDLGPQVNRPKSLIVSNVLSLFRKKKIKLSL